MVKETVAAALVAFLVSIALCQLAIPFLEKLKFGQQVRDDGPQEHLKKQGTPTMGGLMILASIVVTSLIFMRRYPKILPVLLVTVGFGLIGFLDDYLKIVKKSPEGLTPGKKLLAQFVVTVLFALYLMGPGGVGTKVLIPFSGGFGNGYYLDLGLMFIPAVVFVMLGTDNGVNFTDGLDGLCASVTITVAGFFTVASLMSDGGISPLTAAVAGALLGFLPFNAYRARVFMGDTGSLTLGGFVGASAFMLRMPLFIPIAGVIYLIEVVSVIMQVAYFKATGGKRIFRMAPIHHHLELGGWHEAKVVAVFTVVTAVACMVACLGL